MNASTATVELQIPLAVPRARAWEALTSEIDAWWLGDFRVVAPDSTLTLEPRAGGLLLESKPGGGSLLWFTVTLVTPGEGLHLVGHIAPPWGGPAVSMLSLVLKDSDEGCVLELTDALLCPDSMAKADGLEAGWKALFGTGLKQHLEGAPA